MLVAVPIVVSSYLNSQSLIEVVAVILLFAVGVRLYSDPLSHIPGPFIARFTPLWLWLVTWRGVECRTVAALHKRYGKVVRVAPNEVDISDGTAIHHIYTSQGGFLKSPFYRNYDFNGFETIFSTQNPVHRSKRAKAVAPLFAQHAIIKARPVVQRVIDATVIELERRKNQAMGQPVDVLNLFRAFSLESVCVYLLGESFNGVGKEKLSATAFVDDSVAIGRFFYLPGWMFNRISSWAAALSEQKAQIDQSNLTVNEFATQVVTRSVAEEKDGSFTYQGRLLHAGISHEETVAQVVDIMFAGTDSAAMTLTVICRCLAENPDKYERVRQEVLENPNVDAQSLPYLSGVVKEGLRLARATPTRLPRIVPAGGFHVSGLPFLPAGTSVGLGAYILQQNPDVFPDPQNFQPERWLDPTPEMLRDSFYFGMGARQCIARNFASAELWWAAEALVQSNILRDAKPTNRTIEIKEWFNSRVIGGKIELQWGA